MCGNYRETDDCSCSHRGVFISVNEIHSGIKTNLIIIELQPNKPTNRQTHKQAVSKDDYFS